MIRKAFSFIVCCFIGLYAAGVFAQVKIDPYLEIPLNSDGFKASITDGAATEKAQNTAGSVDVFIKTSDIEATRAAIEFTGGAVRVVAGDVITATVDGASVAGIAQGAEIVFVEGSKPMSFANDVASNEIGATEIHSGSAGLPAAYLGKGVIVGIVDTGIDYAHPDFMDADGKSRVLAIWDQNSDSGSAPAELENSYGTECVAADIAGGACPLKDTDGHGTHVAGTAAGRNETYGGIAPDANIIAVMYNSSLDLGSGYAETIFSTKICEAAYYVFAKAAALGMPAVVNLSLGTHLGAHDGTSLFEQCLSGLVKDVAGRAIVAAAGNEYSTNNQKPGIHTGFEVNGFSATNFVIEKISKDKIYYIDLWGPKGGGLSVGLAIRNGAPPGSLLGYSDLVGPGGRKQGRFIDGGFEYLINATETQSALNGKQHVGIRITVDPSIVSSPSNYSFDLIVKGMGSFDAWLFPDKPSQTILFTSVSGGKGNPWTFVPGDSLKCVAIPSSAPDIIAVGGYTTRNSWTGPANCCQVQLTLGDLIDFSSSGPSADPDATGVKPDIAAPGAMIASALSQFSGPRPSDVVGDGKHLMMAGTSMAAPFVSGTAALMFSANPNFTADDVKKYLTESAYKDDSTGEVPNDRWGHGKLNSLVAVEKALAGGASGNFSGDVTAEPEISEPSSSSSSGGCSLTAEKTGNNGGASLLIFAALIVLVYYKILNEKILSTKF